MTRSTKAQKSERLNAAYGLLAQGHDVTAAVTLLSQRFDLSQRQAYRYVQVASNMSQLAPIHEALVPITMKLPGSVAAALRTYSKNSGRTIGEIVSAALSKFMSSTGRHG